MLHPPPLLKFLHLFVISSQQLKRWSIRKPFPLGRRGLRPDGREVETGGDRGIPGQQQRSCARNGGCCWGVVQIGGKTWYFDGQATTFKPSRINLGIHLYIYIYIYMYLYVNMCVLYIYLFIYLFNKDNYTYYDIQYNTLHHTTIQYNTIQYNTYV